MRCPDEMVDGHGARVDYPILLDQHQGRLRWFLIEYWSGAQICLSHHRKFRCSCPDLISLMLAQPSLSSVNFVMSLVFSFQCVPVPKTGLDVLV